MIYVQNENIIFWYKRPFKDSLRLSDWLSLYATERLCISGLYRRYKNIVLLGRIAVLRT